MDNTNKITKKDLVKVLLRSFLIAVGWNFERMQAIGFLYTTLPAIKKLYPQPEERKTVLLRNLEFFNTHPYLANIIIGITLGMEELQISSGKTHPEMISSIKKQTAGPLAALGDSFFWSTWRPLVALITISFFLVYQDRVSPTIVWFPIIIFLVIYNIFHLHVRYSGLFGAYKKKLEIIAQLKQRNLQAWITGFRFLGVTLTVFWLFYLVCRPSWNLQQQIVLFLLFLLSLFLNAINISSTKLLYLVIILNLILHYFKIV